MDCSEMAKLSLMVSLSPEMEEGMSVPDVTLAERMPQYYRIIKHEAVQQLPGPKLGSFP